MSEVDIDKLLEGTSLENMEQSAQLSAKERERKRRVEAYYNKFPGSERDVFEFIGTVQNFRIDERQFEDRNGNQRIGKSLVVEFHDAEIIQARNESFKAQTIFEMPMNWPDSGVPNPLSEIGVFTRYALEALGIEGGTIRSLKGKRLHCVGDFEPTRSRKNGEFLNWDGVFFFRVLEEIGGQSGKAAADITEDIKKLAALLDGKPSDIKQSEILRLTKEAGTGGNSDLNSLIVKGTFIETASSMGLLINDEGTLRFIE